MSKLSSAARRAVLISLACILFVALAARSAANPIIEIGLPSPGADPEGITYGPDGAYWFVEAQAGKIGRITTGGAVTEYFIPSGACLPIGIVTGPDSNLWFTEYQTRQLGRITTNGTITEYPLPAGIFPNNLTVGPDHRLWVLDFGGQFNSNSPPPTNGGIFAVTITTNGITNLSYYNSNLTLHSRPANITTNPDGNLYFTEQLTGKIGRITTNGVISESALLTTNSQPFDITTGPDGALWFTEANSNKLGRIVAGFSTNFSDITEYPLPTNATGFTVDQPIGLIVGPDTNLWYTDPPAACLTRVNLTNNSVTLVVTTNVITNFDSTVTTNIFTNAAATQFFTPTAFSYPRRLATGPDGDVWFGEFVLNQLGFQNNIGRFVMPVPLSIQSASNSQVVISWTTNVTSNFKLQTNSDLTTTNWGFATNVPAILTNRFVVTNSVTNGNLFFRLFE